MRKHSYKIIVMVLIVTFLIVSLCPQSFCDGDTNPILGSVLFTEFLAGVAGASLGGMAGSLAIKSLSSPSEETAGFLNLTGLGLGVSLGTTAGVALAGYLYGVKGNLLLTFAGSAIGLVESYVITSVLNMDLEKLTPWLKIVLFTVPPAFNATLGYNVGARKEEGDKASTTKGARELEAPLFQLNF